MIAMENKIYLVMYACYSDWHIYGYFTDRNKADKYCVEHKDQGLYVKEIDSFDELTGDFLKITPKYEYNFIFSINDYNGEWCLDKQYESGECQSDYTCYDEPFLRSNRIDSNSPQLAWIRIFVNTGERDFEKAKKIAIDLFYQFKSMCGEEIHKKDIIDFNYILNKEERERKAMEKEEKTKRKELAMLAKLKAKYENN